MLFLVRNDTLIKDREKTYLTAAAASAATTLTVADINGFGVDDYIIIGKIGSDTTELVKLHAGTAPSGTTITLAAGLSYAHGIDTPIQRTPYNQVEFSRATTETGSKSTLTTIAVQPDDFETRYEDTTNTTGYGFVRFKNSTSSAFSSYSDAIPYAGQTAKSVKKLTEKVRSLINEPTEEFIDDSEILDAINDKQREIAHERLWSFYEKEKSFSSVDDQFVYDVPSTVQKIHTVRFDTQPLTPIGQGKWELLHWDTDQSTGDPTHCGVWNNQIKVYPRPNASASSTTLGAAISSTTATSITVAATSTFKRGDFYRFIIDSEVIYATTATSTTFTGCLRGQEGTTAATHSNGATVTERDIVYTVHEEPTDLVDINDETQIPEPEVLALGVAADLALKLTKETLHDRLLIRYQKRIKDLEEKYSTKISGKFSVVKDAREVVSGFTRNPNDFPTGLTD